MCGIIGYVGGGETIDVLISGLHRLEYRGYDSSGIAVLDGGNFYRERAKGRISELELKIQDHKLNRKPAGMFKGASGIGHTRWATHGKPSEENAHPHMSQSGAVMVVHNGIIENFETLREGLAARGAVFTSETDTEVLPYLIESLYCGDLEAAVKSALRQVRGTYGLAVLHKDHLDLLIAARRGSPMVIGVGEGEMFVASDVNAFSKLTGRVVYMEDSEVVALTPDNFTISTLGDRSVDRAPEQLDHEDASAELGEFEHHMLKEIFEQPRSLTNAIRGRLLHEEGTAVLGGLQNVLDRLKSIEHLVIVSCGTSLYAGLFGRYIFGKLTGLKVEVEIASEMRYSKTNIREGTAVLALSQSGETADTIAALREAQRKGALILGITNVVGSTIARMTEAGVYNHAGPEIGVASTKVFTSQCVILTLIALLLGRFNRLEFTDGQEIIAGLERLPGDVAALLDKSNHIHYIARKYSTYSHMLFIGRKYCYPMAMEGALKLKEISYIHAEGSAAGEMKHGFIAMIDSKFPTAAIVLLDGTYEKTVSNIQEIRSREGKVIAFATEGDEAIGKLVNDVISIPKNLEFLQPITAAVALQLFAYFVALENGCPIDKPRNLAKSVTVE